jgi:hypothetical protein
MLFHSLFILRGAPRSTSHGGGSAEDKTSASQARANSYDVIHVYIIINSIFRETDMRPLPVTRGPPAFQQLAADGWPIRE